MYHQKDRRELSKYKGIFIGGEGYYIVGRREL
jgi:hypothetical protein